MAEVNFQEHLSSRGEKQSNTERAAGEIMPCKWQLIIGVYARAGFPRGLFARRRVACDYKLGIMERWRKVLLKIVWLEKFSAGSLGWVLAPINYGEECIFYNMQTCYRHSCGHYFWNNYSVILNRGIADKQFSQMSLDCNLRFYDVSYFVLDQLLDKVTSIYFYPDTWHYSVCQIWRNNP